MAKILIVDDRPVCREFLTTLLKHSHHTLVEAENGSEALKLLTSEHPELVITDILMPTMNGYELVQKMRADSLLTQIPVIFYTASFLEDEANLLAQACDVKYLVFKPCDPQLILDTINVALGIKTEDVSGEIKHERSMMEIIAKVHPSSSLKELRSYLSDLDNTKKEFTSVTKVIKKLDDHESLLKTTAQFTGAFNQLGTITGQLLALTELSLSMMSARDAMHVLKLFCEGANKILGTKYCCVGILEDNDINSENKKLMHYLVSGSDGITENKLTANLTDSGLIKQTFASITPVKMNRISEPFKSEFKANNIPVNHFLGSRLMTTSHLYGFIYFSDKLDGTEFTEVDSHIARTLAAEIAMLYENITNHVSMQ